jgi:hypothetical protein
MSDYVIATEDLYLPNSITLAHLKGSQVPKENVEPNGWQDQVANPTTKAAKSVTE